MFRPTLFAALLASTFAAHAATSKPLTATQVLNQLNVVSLDTINSQSHVDGRTWAAGSVTGGDYGQHLSSAPASSYAGLTAGGSASNLHVNGGGAVVGGSLANATVNSGASVVKGGVANTNFNGAAYVAGTASSTNFNGGRATSPTTAMQASSAAATSTDFGKVLGNLSTAMSTLKSTDSKVTMQGNKAVFNAKPNSSGVAVFDLTAIDEQLFKLGEFQFNLNGATTVILNTDVKTASISANFLGGGAQAIGSKTIWNFYDATNLTIGSQFGGAVLATDALLTNYQNIEGGVYVHDLKQYGEIHLQAFTGNVDFVAAAVPEPDTVALLLAGLAVIGAVRLRRRG
ncbi:putative secreted protein with PEP-CTERM sorting signal/choice-of-anchor A domain-containing protein [Pseudoduganella flava]|uniref:Choice-of-anchor A family protein n=1 Tax=Pseudoduganella flava TaxID=871742 RepID=A0A562Q3M0_9BURK|nr:choice-of-anchor A family protein [Pseudoduganella flava]QGZ41383.1 choice-of-anchor A family protein [Pseudoduganella flava]TWI51332.1 putative secreted protein with PEP-CTERM sorting signal/choice-of-anchor A domain-containing protein [Pseudoduganella flava]